MNTKTTQVCYRNFVTADPDGMARAYHAAFNRLAAWFSDKFFLNLFGRLRRDTLANARYEIDKKSNKDKSGEQFPDEIILFFNWFSLEDAKGAENAVAAGDVYAQFAAYCKADGLPIDPRWAETLKATALAIDPETSTWVDRRRNKLPLAPATTDWLFGKKNFILQETAPDCMVYAGQLLSDIWGDGAKADWGRSGKLVASLQQFSKLQPHQIREAALAELGLTADATPNTVTKALGKIGRPSQLCNFLGGKTKIKEVAEFEAMIDKEIGRSKEGGCPDDHGFNVLLEQVQKDTGLPYSRSHYADAAAKALERITSNRKNNLNAIWSRHTIDRTKPVTPDWLEKALKRWMSDREQPYLTGGDKEGFTTVQRFWTGSWAASVEAAKKHARRNGRFNTPLLEYLAAKADENTAAQAIAYADWGYQEHKFHSLRPWRLARFTNKPDHPRFGNSRPAVKFPETDRLDYQIQILTPKGKAAITLPTVNKRLRQEMFGAGTVEAPRRTKLFAALHGTAVDNIKPTAQPKGLKLKVDGDALYCHVNYEHALPEPTPRDELAKLAVGSRFLGVDPGIRKNITYAVGEIVSSARKDNYTEGKTPYVYLAPGRHVKITEVGHLRERDFWYGQADSRRRTCRLESDTSDPVTPELVKCWKRLRGAGLVKNDCPETKLDFLCGAAGALLAHSRQKAPNPSHLLDVLETLKIESRRSGACSYKRIKALMNLKRALHAVARKAPQDWVGANIDFMTDKIRHLREDRSCRTPNLISAKAVATGCRAVFIENTSLDVHAPMSRNMKRNIDIWTPRRVVEKARQQLKTLAVECVLQASQYSSHADFATGREKPRYDTLSADMIAGEIQYWQDRKNDGRTDALYRAEVNRLGRDTLDKKYPKRGGRYYKSDLLGWIDADQNAAMGFLVAGLKNLVNRAKA